MVERAPIRILMVEDNARDAALVKGALRHGGLNFHARCVDNEKDFLQNMESYAPDLILSDHGLSNFGGRDALALAREKLPEIPFIFFTSSHGEESAIQAFKGGAVDYVLKNRLDDLVPAVQQALAQADERSRRHQAEEALHRSEESFRILVESVKGYAIYMLDQEGNIASWNAGAQRLEGYEAAEVIGRHFSIFSLPEDISAGKPSKLLRTAIAEGRVEDEGWVVRKDGSRLWCEVVITAIHDQAGRLTGFSKVAHDITPRKKDEETLKAHISRQAVVAELGQRALVTSDFSALINEAVELVAQTCAADFSLLLALQPDERKLLLRAGVGWKDGSVGVATVDPSPATHAGYALTSDKPVIFEDLSRDTRFCGAALLQEHGVTSGLNVIIRQPGAPYGVLGVYTRRHHTFTQEDVHFVQSVANVISGALERQRSDQQLSRFNYILERRVAQRTAQLEAANKELESFSYSVSHDLRTPLRHIGGFVEMLKRSVQDKWDEQSRSLLEIIAESSKKMDDLINDLLAFSRMGCSEMRQTRLNMGWLVEKARGEFEAELKGRSVVFKVADLPEIAADPVLLRQVWINLIGNALKYSRTRAESRIEIGAREEEQETVFWVRDNGVGFDPQYAGKLFGVFQRLHPAREFEGTGIGLAIVRRIIARHGGRTWAESTLGQGATFFFSLPKSPEETHK